MDVSSSDVHGDGVGDPPTRLKKPMARASLTAANASLTPYIRQPKPNESSSKNIPDKTTRKSNTVSVFDRLHDDQRKRDARAQRQREIAKMKEDALYSAASLKRSTKSPASTKRSHGNDSSRFERESSASGSSAYVFYISLKYLVVFQISRYIFEIVFIIRSLIESCFNFFV